MYKEIKSLTGETALVNEEYSFLNKLPWTVSKSGYFKLNIDMHKIIISAPKGMYIDHINGDKLDNRRENLRVCTNSENLRNQKKTSKKTSSQYKGVSWNKNAKKWEAVIGLNSKKTYLGRYNSETEAAQSYNFAAKKLHGIYARLNIISA